MIICFRFLVRAVLPTSEYRTAKGFLPTMAGTIFGTGKELLLNSELVQEKNRPQ